MSAITGALAAQASSPIALARDIPMPVMILYVLAVVFMIVAMWKVFEKAGQPGWAAIVPIYNLYVLCVIAGKPGWWLLLMLIPLVNIVIAIIVYLAVAERFGKGGGFAVGLILLPIIFWPILAFGDATYQPA